MRLDRLDLLAYGHFDGRRLEFAPDARLHVVYGPNEAGKSTTLAAVVDLLYGFKAKDHPYTFKHPKPLLGGRVGAADGRTLEFLRMRVRQGAGLLTPDQSAALPDDALAPFLLGVTKEEFERLHALDNPRLKSGGREMLDPASDIGRKLFAAGAGLEDLHRAEQALAEAVERLGENIGGRGQKHQALKAAAADFEAADKDLKAAVLKHGELEKARRRLETAETAAAEARAALERLREEKTRLERIQRVRPLLAELDRRREGLGGRGDLPSLPESLADDWRAAETNIATAAAALRRAEAAEAEAIEELAALAAPGPYLGQAKAIEALAAQAGEYQKDGADLPRREAERRVKHDDLQAALRGLGLADLTATDMSCAAVESRLPGAVARKSARDLSARRQKAGDALATARRGLETAERNAAAAEKALAALGPVVAAGEAEALAAKAGELADAPTKLEAVKALARDAQFDADAALADLAALGLWRGDAAALAALTTPDAAPVEARDHALKEFAQLEARLTAAQTRLETDKDDAQAAIDAADAVGAPPSQAAVDAARRHRDRGVSLLAAGAGADAHLVADYAQGRDLVEAVTAAVRDADQLADRRATEARRVEAYETALKNRAAATAALVRLAAERRALDDGRAAADVAWRAAWAPVTAAAPAQMRGWLTARGRALDLSRKADKAAAELAAAETRAGRWRDLWRAAALALGLDDESGGSDAALAALTKRRLDDARQQAQRRRDLVQRRDEAAAAAAVALQDLTAAQDRRHALDADWAALTPQLGQSADLSDAGLEAALDLWETAEAAVKDLRELDRRIDGMRRDRAGFETRMEELRALLEQAGVASPADPAAALAAVRQGLDDDRQRETVREQKKLAAAKAHKATAAAAKALGDAEAQSQTLRAAHGLSAEDDVLALCAAAAALSRLNTAGEGRGETDLRAQAAALDGDAAAARLATLDAEQAQAQAAYDHALTERGEAKSGWEQLQQDGGAEALARRRGEAARRAGLAAAELMQVKAAQFLLRRAVERYREANQDPLLGRASALFAAAAGALPGGDPIAGLESLVGDDGRPTLHVRRRSGAALAVAGLSEGTGDQLFLALRLAALEQRTDAGRPLPFIVDDVFQTFDDDRTAACLALLAELGRRAQIIVFTHHRHVVRAAERAAAGAADVIDLSATPALPNSP